MVGLVYHGPHGEPYYVTDSAYGIARAAAEGFPAIDLNIRTCRANKWRPWRRRRRAVVVHWSRWWEHGFRPKAGTQVPRKPIERLTLAQVRNLVSDDGQHEILTAEEALDLCAEHGIFPLFEMKPSAWPLHVLRRLVAHSRGHWPFVLTTIQTYGHSPRARKRWERQAYVRMAKARAAGAHTCLLYRRPLSWAHWAPVLTGIKNRPGRRGVLGLRELIHLLKTEARA